MRRTWLVVLAAVVAVAMVSGCSQTPAQHQERLRKAAGVTAFRITCTKDLWERTRTSTSFEAKGKVTDKGGGIALIELTGPQLVDYLRALEQEAFPAATASDPLAYRMYNALAVEIDKIRPGVSGADTPAVTVDDRGGAPAVTSPSASPEASP